MERQVIYRGPGILTILQIVFIVLKLCNVVTWPWLVVLIPLWISLGITIFIGIVFILTVLIIAWLKSK